MLKRPQARGEKGATMKKICLGLTVIGMMTLFAACTPSVGFIGPSLTVPVELDVTPDQPAQQQTTQQATQPAPTEASSTTATTAPQQPIDASQAQVAAGSAGNIATSIKVLPGNAFPFEDGFENFSAGQVLAIAAPQNYGILRLDGKDDPTFAKLEQTFDVKNQPSKAMQLNNTEGYEFYETQGYVTLGSAESQNYTASFDFKIDSGVNDTAVAFLLNIGNGGTSYYKVRINTTAGAVTVDKVLGAQAVQVLNRDGLGFNYADGVYHQAIISSEAGTIRVLVDGNTLVEYNDGDANYQKGGLGLGYIGRSGEGSRLFVDNLRVNSL
jgi:hypothetical protein